MSVPPIPSPELIARLQELELALLSVQDGVQAQVSPWYAEILEDATRLVRCTRMEAERLRSVATGEVPDWALVDQGESEGNGAVLETAASATDAGD